MWLSDRRRFLFGFTALAGCGFSPANGPASQGDKLYNSVFIQAPTNRVEFELVRHLEGRLGRALNRKYNLLFTLSIDQKAAVVSAAQETDRFSLVGTLDYSLIDANGSVILKATETSFTSYASTGTTLATEQSKRDAEDRLMIILGDQLNARLLATFGS
ncbi:MAG: hypothetical protein OSB34_06980 [Planktomarina sp.]|nr:hypothetical protein [Planktomarina sp.]